MEMKIKDMYQQMRPSAIRWRNMFFVFFFIIISISSSENELQEKQPAAIPAIILKPYAINTQVVFDSIQVQNIIRMCNEITISQKEAIQNIKIVKQAIKASIIYNQ